MPPKKAPVQPDYTLLTLAQLQKQVAKYGFKLSNERSVLISQLERCWTALHPAPDPSEAIIGEEGGEGGAPAVGKVKQAKAPKAPKKQPKTAEEKEEDERRAKEQLVEFIRGDEELYMKVLRYEPISFEQIVAFSQGKGLKLSRVVILKCMDEQSVTVYTMDPNDKTPRTRYR